MSNTIGNIFRLTTYGESHGPAIGGIIDGMPSGVAIDIDFIQSQLNRRRPGQSDIVTARNEKDRVEILSGVYDGVSTGTPLAFEVRNSDHHSSDYNNMADTYRPSHADMTYDIKYGIRDHRGGGRSSARETVARVAAGAIAMLALRHTGIEIYAYTRSVGEVELPCPDIYPNQGIEDNIVRCPDAATAQKMIELIREVKSEGDTIGGVVEGVIKNCPAGLGEPTFGKLHAMLGASMLSINAAKGFEYGMGFAGTRKRGSEVVDIFAPSENGKIHTLSNYSGGIQGGISNGETIYFRVAFKPVATLLKEVPTIDTQGRATILKAKGRHDPCVVARAVPIVEAMSAITILDALLMNRATRI